VLLEDCVGVLLALQRARGKRDSHDGRPTGRQAAVSGCVPRERKGCVPGCWEQ
jgi:hypothetical protein